MKYTIILGEDPTILIENVHSIENETDEIVFRDASNEIIAIVSKNDYKAIVATK